MKRKIITALCLAMGTCMLSCCQLARENAGTATHEDRMIGVFITTEYLDLFDMEGYLNDNLRHYAGGEINMSDGTEEYQGRLYAALTTITLTNEETGEQTEMQDYVFEGIEGIPYYAAAIPAAMPEGNTYTSSTSDDAISDGHMSIAEGDGGKTTILEGTLYVLPLNPRVYYLNPVYQGADGRVYLTAGGGISTSGVHDEGSMMSQTFSSDYTVTENSKVQTDRFSITVSISVMSAPEKMVIIQMDADSALLKRTEYMPGEMPERMAVDTETAYLIVETHKRDSTGERSVLREVYGREDESVAYFIAGADGICVKHWVRLAWPD